ncbi:MAG: ABC transporter ATP-binding protein [Lachnospiraceae bacterium]|nr:ABC transporter ATP-binding protein [Lachnospiraceae bacterium]
MSAEIEVKGLYHNFGKKNVLDGIELMIEKGEIFGLLGPSGAGKTTLINILTGQLTSTGGSASIMGKEVSALKGNDFRQIGIMMDHFGLYERMNCYDNLKFYEMLDGKSDMQIVDVLKHVGLEGARKTNVSDLSKGMRNRLSLARVLLRCPKIMFLDEPTSGLDPATTESIHELILQEKKKGTTIFLTTHNMHEAEKLCDHIALLNEGKIVEYGAPEEICRRYNHQKKLLLHLTDGRNMELSHDAAVGKILAELFENGKVETIHSTEPNLETVFMELTGKGLDK